MKRLYMPDIKPISLQALQGYLCDTNECNGNCIECMLSNTNIKEFECYFKSLMEKQNGTHKHD